MPTKWIEWDLTKDQFDAALIEGPAVTAASWDVVTWLGDKFIELSVTAGAHPNGAHSLAVLLFTKTPPLAATLAADIHSMTSPGGVNVGGGVVGRFSAVNSGYASRLNNTDGTGNGWQLMSKLGGTVGSPTIGQIPNFDEMADPAFTAGAGVGMRCGIGVSGETHLRQMAGEEQVGPDLSGPFTSGKMGLMATCSGFASTTVIRFRAICGFDLT
jgi:hypothetical protein